MGLLDRWRKKKTTEQLSSPKPAKLASEKFAEPVLAKLPTTKEDLGRAVVHGESYRILIRPLVTEKSAVMQSSNKYYFIVAPSANKTQIKQAVKELYGVEPLAVNVMNISGRRIRFGRSAGRRSDYKKAAVTLPAGKSITIHEGV